ncbi:MAG TPA: hypothetical protein VGM44_01585 [Polyangiaceae bacterium]|jgi:hypothetical protein
MAKRTPRPIPAAFDEHRFVHESLIEICELLSEHLADSAGNHKARIYNAHDGLDEINRKVWELRWELDMLGGHAVSLADVEPPESGVSGVGIPFSGEASDG